MLCWCQSSLANLSLVLSNLSGSPKASSTSSSYKTALTSRRSVVGTSGRETNVLVVTTSVRMLDWVLSHTSNLWPAITLDSVLVVGVTGLKEGLVGTSTSSNDTNLSTDRRRNGLLTSGRKAKASCAIFVVVSDDNGKCTRSARESTTISRLCLNVTNNSTLGDRRKGQDVTDGQRRFLSAVDELASVHAFGAEQELCVTLVTVSIQKLNLGNRCTSTRIVKNFLDNSTDVTMLLSVIKGSELDSTLTGAYMSLENRGLSLTLGLSGPYLKNKHNPMHYPIEWHRKGRRETKRKSKSKHVDQRGSDRSHDATANRVNPQTNAVGRERKKSLRRLAFITSHPYNEIDSLIVERNISFVTTQRPQALRNYPTPLNTGLDAPECTFPWQIRSLENVIYDLKGNPAATKKSRK